MHPRLWWLRWKFRIGPATPDATIDEAIRRWLWRAGGDSERMGMLLAVALDAGVGRDTLLRVVNEPHPPTTWWDE